MGEYSGDLKELLAEHDLAIKTVNDLRKSRDRVIRALEDLVRANNRSYDPIHKEPLKKASQILTREKKLYIRDFDND